MPRLTQQDPVSILGKRSLCGLAILIFLLFTAFGVAAQYRFDSWTTENGLPQSSVNSIRQTRDGFLWLTTFGGLVRYDGLRFQVFNSNNTKGLTTSRFLNLVLASNGDLWITVEGGGITRYRDSVFTTFAGPLPDSEIGKMGENAERRVLRLISNGRSTKEIAAQLFVSPRTIEHHRAHIFAKLDLTGTNALLAYALTNKVRIQN